MCCIGTNITGSGPEADGGTSYGSEVDEGQVPASTLTVEPVPAPKSIGETSSDSEDGGTSSGFEAEPGHIDANGGVKEGIARGVAQTINSVAL